MHPGDAHRLLPAPDLTRAPAGTGQVRRPSQPSTPSCPASATVIVTVESGEITSGRANSACAAFGTTSSACTSGQTTGPPEENAYAVEPVGDRAHHPVAAEAGQRPVVDLEGHLEHPLPLGLLHRRLVQRPVPGDHLLADPDVDVEGEPLLHPVAALDDVPDGVRQRLRLGLGEEADPAEVDPEQRGPGGPGQLGRAQERAVAAEHQHHLAAGRGRLVRRHRLDVGDAEIGRLVLEHPDLEAGRQQQLADLAGPVDHVPPAGVRDQQRVPAHLPLLERTRPRPSPGSALVAPRSRCEPSRSLTAPPPSRSRPGPPAARRGAARGRTRRCPPAPAAGCGSSPGCRAPARTPGRATVRIASARSCGSRTTPFAPTRSRPTSNCGFTIGSRSSARCRRPAPAAPA